MSMHDILSLMQTCQPVLKLYEWSFEMPHNMSVNTDVLAAGYRRPMVHRLPLR